MSQCSAVTRKRLIRALPMPAVVGMFLVAATLAHAQNRPDFLGLQKSIAKLNGSKANETNPEMVREVISGANEFQKHLQETNTTSTEESAAIVHLRDILSVAASDDLQSAAILRDVNTDLRIKNQYYGARLGVTGQARGLVKVKVATLADSKAVPGLVVYCNPYRWAVSTDHFKSFSKLSSPTEALMLPGLYRCVATKAGGDLAGERSVEIGLDGKDSVDIDIPVKP